MSRIVCFSDSLNIAQTVEHALEGFDVHFLSASRLAWDVRTTVQRLAPDVILLELNRALDNAHLFFFLRSDQTTRSTPVILVSPNDTVAHHAAVLDAERVLPRNALAEHLHHTVSSLLPLERAVAA